MSIVAEGLSKSFDRILAVDGVSFNVAPGQILVILGPNGSGKTTTIRMLSSTLAPTRGWATVNGFDVVRQADRVRRSVGVMTEHHGLYARMTAAEYLDFFAGLYGLERKAARLRAEFLLEAFGLTEARDRRLGTFSRGMRQKLSLSRVLLHDPQVLLLDEPTSAMDPDSARAVRDAIHILKASRRTIVLCTHNLAEAEKLADQVAIIRRGRIIFTGSRADLVDRFSGPQEYDAHFSARVGPWRDALPPGVTITTWGDTWIRFGVSRPEESNPLLLNMMLERGMRLLTYQPVPRDLERAYLAVVSQAAAGQEAAGG